MTMEKHKATKWTGGVAAAALVMTLAGCGAPAGVVFEPLTPAPRWPAPPEAQRIVYLGQLVTNEDLKPAKDPWQGLGEALFGKQSARSMLTPYALCTDGQSRLFVADSNAQCVHVFDLETRRYEQWQPVPPEVTPASPSESAPHGPAPFSQPVGVAYDATGSGRLLVSDSVAGVLFVFDTQGRCTGTLGAGLLKRPCGIAVERGGGRIFVADAAAHQIVVLSATGRELARMGRRGAELGQFNYPTNVALDSKGRLYVTDALNCRIQQFDADLKPLRQIGSRGDMPGYFASPKGIAVDSDDHLYALDAQFECAQVFDDQGRLLLSFGEEGRKPGQFWLPTGIHIDAKDRIWVADSYNRRVQVFDYKTEGKP